MNIYVSHCGMETANLQKPPQATAHSFHGNSSLPESLVETVGVVADGKVAFWSVRLLCEVWVGFLEMQPQSPISWKSMISPLFSELKSRGLCPQLRILYDTFAGADSADLLTMASGSACMEILGFVLKCLFLGIEALWMSSRAIHFN